ncbi:NADH-flavin reductase, partial [Campylobacter fetus]
MKKIAILAANGKAGQAIVYEALSRGFNISAFIRNGLKQQFKDDIKIVQKDIFSLNSENLEGFDYIIDAFGEWGDLNLHKKHIEHLCK